MKKNTGQKEEKEDILFITRFLGNLSEQMVDVGFNTRRIHGRQNRLDGLRLRQLIELLAAVDTRQLQDE